jgi:purine-binding chemotaxis protein CheW
MSDIENTPAVDKAVGSEVAEFLTFNVNNGEYSVDIMQVREIRGWSEATRLPNSPEYVRGVINLRGVIIPIFDLRARFGMAVIDPTAKNVIIILAVGDKTIGILVDSVSDILDVPKSEIRDTPAMDSDISVDFIEGLVPIGNRMVILLNVAKLFKADLENNLNVSNA